MTSLTAFNFNNNQVRILVIDGEPWFVAKDVAEIFDYADLSKMLNLVDAEDKDIINPKKIDSAILAESFNSNTFKVSIINESGLYACIFGSHKPQAKEFKRWVTSQVLPSIRKSGTYSTLNPIPQVQEIGIMNCATPISRRVSVQRSGVVLTTVLCLLLFSLSVPTRCRKKGCFLPRLLPVWSGE